MRIPAMIGLSILLAAATPAIACEDYIQASATETTVAHVPQPNAAAPAAIDLSAATTKKAKKTAKKKKEKVEYMRAAN